MAIDEAFLQKLREKQVELEKKTEETARQEEIRKKLEGAWKHFKTSKAKEMLEGDVLKTVTEQSEMIEASLRLAIKYIEKENFGPAEQILLDAEKKRTIMEEFEDRLKGMEKEIIGEHKDIIKSISSAKSYSRDMKKRIDELMGMIEEISKKKASNG